MAPPRLDISRLHPAVLRALRASHMGETVAVAIYDGVVAAGCDSRLTAFARCHRAVERRHLALFEAMLPPARRSRLMPFWRGAGRFMGWLPARVGPYAFFTVIGAVEGWVDGHYARQIALVRRLHPDPDLLRLLHAVRNDEAHHGRDAQLLRGRAPPGLRLLASVLAAVAVWSSRVGVLVGRWV